MVKLEFILDSILEVNMPACMVHKELRSTIGDTILLENSLPLDTLKVMDAVVMLGAVDKVDVVWVVVVVEELEAGIEATLKAKLPLPRPLPLT